MTLGYAGIYNYRVQALNAAFVTFWIRCSATLQSINQGRVILILIQMTIHETLESEARISA